MTNKQIIINSIDVSGCEHCLKMTKYRCTIQRDVYKCLCEENPNCHYKLYKRKEQENEELKKNYFTVIQQRNIAEQQLDQIKAENEKLEEEVQYLKSEIERISE